MSGGSTGPDIHVRPNEGWAFRRSVGGVSKLRSEIPKLMTSRDQARLAGCLVGLDDEGGLSLVGLEHRRRRQPAIAR